MSEMSREQFIEKSPLYTAYDMTPQFYPPGSVSLECAQCKKETTWSQAENVDLLRNKLSISSSDLNTPMSLEGGEQTRVRSFSAIHRRRSIRV